MVLALPSRFYKLSTGLLFGLSLLPALCANANDLATANQLYSQGEYKQSLKILEALPKDLKTYKAMLTNLVQIDIDEAEELSDQAIAAFNNEPELYLIRASIMGAQAQSSIFSALGYAEKALNSFKKAAELAPTGVKYQQALMMFYLAAPSIAGGDEDLGFRQVERIQALDEIEGQIALLRYYQMTDKNDLLKEAMTQTMQQYPTEVSFPFNYGSYLAQQEQYDEAMKYLHIAANIDIPAFVKDESSDELSAIYVRNAEAHLQALYQIGRTAVLSKKFTEQGINAMKTLFDTMENVEFAELDLPRESWGRTRLAELLIRVNEKEQANKQLSMIKVGEDKDLEKAVKKLRKEAK
ncbi:MAG: hypothetical protein NWQ54_09805 [Paraglaciecola sp.]|uniref:tetratricopeptide repeat protein n=1 Tax=Paraglaciecola sp. TaxID=1920173 RepID=UPI00273D7D12|nr:hypothetical protein [Paraglaciecola sp.]MDP5029086.1 hypothetical protein [Paraglaciecola sp.]MDP5131171.1 hypothetical protein [Paraglaciecola sp.]